jgi:tRNA-dihydrouridine synthase
MYILSRESNSILMKLWLLWTATLAQTIFFCYCAFSMHIWQELAARLRPFSVLAPMEEVTDSAFRSLLVEIGRPDIFFTEFTSVEGMQSRGREHVIHRLTAHPAESPLIAQIWGTTPEFFEQTAREIVQMGYFAGIDINMGCPVKKIIKGGGCGGLIRNPQLATQIYHATTKGASTLPVSIKTRIGFSGIETESWVGHLLATCSPAALTIHGRTIKEESKVPVHPEELAKVPILRDRLSPHTVLIANGDIGSVPDGQTLCKEMGFDGYMIGRGVFHNPWVFDPAVDPATKSPHEKLALLLRHTELFCQQWESAKNFAILRRFFKIYASGFDGASDLRVQLMECTNQQEVTRVVQNAKILTFLEENAA